MKLKIVDTNKTEKGSKELPIQFAEPVRDDLIQRSVLAIEANEIQAFGVKLTAGKRHSSEVSKRRRDYKTSYGHGISRVPRKVLSRNGTQMNWVGALMPGTVGGRVAHPSKANRDWTQKVNVAENRKAIRSAIAATIDPALVQARGHRIPKEFPFIIDAKVESLSKTSDVFKALEKLGFGDELARTAVRKVRAGKGKGRGRKYQTKVGPLFVVADTCALAKAAKNIPGVAVTTVKQLNAKILAPGAQPGRLTLWSESAIDALTQQKLFTAEYKGVAAEKKAATPKKTEEKKAPVKKAAAKKSK